MAGFNKIFKKSTAFSLAIVSFLVPSFFGATSAYAASSLSQRFDKIASSIISDVTTHQIGFIMTNTTTSVGSVTIEFCSNTPIIEDPCTFPIGFSASSTTISNQTGETGFSLHPSSTANKIVLTRVPVNPTGVAATYDFSNITNPSANGTYFVRIRTYSSIDASGLDIQNGGVVIHINDALNVSGEVPPYINFCVAVAITSFDCSTANNFFIDFGTFLSASASHATSQFVVGSNAVSGYSITVSGTTLTSGLNTIPAMTTPAGSIPGTSQFGVNLRQNTVPADGSEPVGPGTATPKPNYNIPNLFTYNNSDIIASVTHSDDTRKFTVNYLTNISNGQAGGVYSTTISYICLANF